MVSGDSRTYYKFEHRGTKGPQSELGYIVPDSLFAYGGLQSAETEFDRLKNR